MGDALSVISLQSAKDFLVVDYPDRDAEITRHIKSAIGFIEQYTNVMMYEREKTYTLSGCSIEIYDAPITLVTTVKVVRHNVLSLTIFGQANDVIAATVGYSDVTDVPSALIDAAYKVILYLFENKDLYSVGLPLDIQLLINQFRRSIM